MFVTFLTSSQTLPPNDGPAPLTNQGKAATPNKLFCLVHTLWSVSERYSISTIVLLTSAGAREQNRKAENRKSNQKVFLSLIVQKISTVCIHENNQLEFIDFFTTYYPHITINLMHMAKLSK